MSPTLWKCHCLPFYFVFHSIILIFSFESIVQPSSLPQMSLSVTSLLKISEGFFSEYQTKTPLKLKLIDVYLGYILLSGILQFVYCVLVGTFPFNSFLSGFSATVGAFVLAGNWRCFFCCFFACKDYYDGLWGKSFKDLSFFSFFFSSLIPYSKISDFSWKWILIRNYIQISSLNEISKTRIIWIEI